MSLAAGFRCEGKKGGRKADNPKLAQKILFHQLAPDLMLLENGFIRKLIACVWKWVHVPNLECNNQWIKESLGKLFKIHSARVVFSGSHERRKTCAHCQN